MADDGLVTITIAQNKVEKKGENSVLSRVGTKAEHGQ